MALSQPVQNGAGDLQRELLASRYSSAAPLEAVLPGTDTAVPKAEDKHAFASQDWFERSSEKADGGRTALKNLIARVKSIADAAAQREAAARVGQSPASEPAETEGPLPPASVFVPPPASWATPNTSPSGSTTTASDSGSTSGSTSTGNTPSGQGQGLLNKLLGG